MSDKVPEMKLGGHLTMNRKISWLCLLIMALVLVVSLIPSISSAISEDGNWAWLGSAMVGAMAGLGAATPGMFREQKRNPVYAILKSNGLEVPGNPLYNWTVFEQIERSDGGLLFKSSDFENVTVFIPIPSGSRRYRAVVSFLREHAPMRLSEKL